MVVNEKADRQHAIASALELPSIWAKKFDDYNLVQRGTWPTYNAGVYLCMTQMAESCLSYSMKLAYC